MSITFELLRLLRALGMQQGPVPSQSFDMCVPHSSMPCACMHPQGRLHVAWWSKLDLGQASAGPVLQLSGCVSVRCGSSRQCTLSVYMRLLQLGRQPGGLGGPVLLQMLQGCRQLQTHASFVPPCPKRHSSEL